MTSDSRSTIDSSQAALDAQTVALRVIAGLMIAGAAWLLASLLVPAFSALVVAIVMVPLANRLERSGLSSSLSALVGLLLVVVLLGFTGGLLGYQASILARQSDRYMDRMAEILSQSSQRFGLDRLLSEDPDETSTARDEAAEEGNDRSTADASPVSTEESLSAGDRFSRALRSSYQSIAGWLARGLGGLLGLIGEVVVFLAFLYYMLATRSEWRSRLEQFVRRLGMLPPATEFDQAQHAIRRYALCVSLVAITVGVLVSVMCAMIGLPTPVAWGVLAGLLEFVPYFGPLIAGSALAVVALATGDGWFEPTVVVAVYVIIETVEGYVISPLLYGGAVELNPVLVLFGLLFFGWIWGPVGLLISIPMLVILRCWINLAPDTPALHALHDEAAAQS